MPGQTVPPDAPANDIATTGIRGLDAILRGGLTPHRLHLIEGVPGAGKTTLALQFLIEGARRGEPVLYVTLSETEEELRAVADSHGWSLDGVAIREIIPSHGLERDEQYTMFHPSEVELHDTMATIRAELERSRPVRVVFDSLSEMRLLAGTPLRYRRQILALKHFFVGLRCTVLMLDDRTASEHDLQVQSIAHGVILLDQSFPEYGAERRRLRIVKCRGRTFSGGNHDYVIRRGGLEVFPRVVAAEHRQPSTRDKIASGVAELDSLLGGGIERSTSTLIIGAAGTGKSTLAAQFVAAATARGHRAAMFLFDEHVDTLLNRADGLRIDLRGALTTGNLTIQQIDPAEMPPGQFAHAVRSAVEEQNASIIVVDSLNGYLNAMPQEHFLTEQLHELLMYLGQLGVATILIAAHQGLIGTQMTQPVDASYLADAIILLRYFEARGRIRQAISVVKKRGGEHERTIREFRLEDGRLSVGEPLSQFRGVLTGTPSYEGTTDPLLREA